MTQQNFGTIIDNMMADHRRLMSYLNPTGDISLQARVEAAFSKTLVMSAASYFETKLTGDVVQVFRDETGSDALASFVRTKAVERRYHDWFAWERRNANRFFQAFGAEFLDTMQEIIKSDPALDESIRAFMELGELRNTLAHENYASFNMSKTVGEVYELYQKAERLVERLPGEIRNFIRPVDLKLS